MDSDAARIYDLAARLRRAYGRPGDLVPSTQVECHLAPTDVLAALRRSAIADLVPADGSPLTHPEHPSYGPIQLVAADPQELTAAQVTASTWDRHPHQGRAASLEIRLVFEHHEVKAQEEYSLWASETSSPSLTRSVYDHQRAETGYEGEDRISVAASTRLIDEFLAIVSWMTGEDIPAGPA